MQIKSKYKAGYKKKNELKKYCLIIISSILFVGVIGLGCYLIFYVNQKDTKESSTKTQEITVYTAADMIQHGQPITASMLVETKGKSLYENYYCSLDCIGQIAIVDIPKGMPIMQNMCRSSEVEPEDREVECEIIKLSGNLIENDYVDVRLMLPNGEDYIVLAKKGVHELFRSEEEKEEVCYLWLSEEEILYYSAAVVDAYLYQGACLYTTKYIEPTLQEASIVTYVPSLGTLAMMKENPNLYELAVSQLKLDERKLLENRLTDYINLDIRERNWNIVKDQSEDGSQQGVEDRDKDVVSEDENAMEENDKEDSKIEDNSQDKNSQDKVNQAAGNPKEETNVEVETKVEDEKVDASAFLED